MPRKITVKHCNNCPYRTIKQTTIHVCNLINCSVNKEDFAVYIGDEIVSIRSFPEWCPLPKEE